MTNVVLQNLRKTYPNGFEAVRGVNLDVRSGEFIALLGPSGCGKTTTLRMVAGLESITGGTLSIGDRIVNDIPARDRGVAMVFQSYALYPHMTVFENMAFGLRLRKIPVQEISRRVNEVAERLDITELLPRKPSQMSGGQRQRVAMGRAIVREPDVFLFDEPLSNLDARLRLKMRFELSKLHQSLGTTSLYVTHDQTEAMTLADRILLMRKGEVQQLGTPLELYTRPANRFVAEFIGSPTMNVVPGHVGDGVLRLGDFQFPLPKSFELAAGDYSIGIRPQDILLSSGVDSGRKVAVTMVEPLGNETMVHCESANLVLVGRVEGSWVPRTGDMLGIDVNLDHLHVFDLETGRRVNQ